MASVSGVLKNKLNSVDICKELGKEIDENCEMVSTREDREWERDRGGEEGEKHLSLSKQKI